MMEIADKIIEFLRKNRVSTTEVADALGKTGVMSGILPVTNDLYKVGRVHTVFTGGGSNYGLHDQLPSVREGEIVVVFAHDCDGLAILGDLVSRYALFYRGAAALVVDGMLRDIDRLRRERYPIWARGATPLGCANQPAEEFPQERMKDLRSCYEGGVAVCDGGGVVVIPTNCLDREMLERLELIELQEDIWSFCLNTLKWDTKMIVGDREYLKMEKVLPPEYREKLHLLKKRFTRRC